MTKNLLILFIILTFCLPLQAVMGQKDLAALADEAGFLFRQANEAAPNDWGRANELYDEAILRYKTILEEGEIANPYIYYNLGNAYLFKGDVGRAILNFRRAERFESNDLEFAANLKTNLQAAMEKRVDHVPVMPQKKLMQTLFFWHYDLNLRTRFVLICIFWAMSWSLFTLRLIRRKGGSQMGLAVSFLLIATIFAGSVAAEMQEMKTDRAGVITAEEVVARRGDGLNYEPSFTLHSGTEFQVREQRALWWRIELANGDQGWIPDNAGSQVVPDKA